MPELSEDPGEIVFRGPAQLPPGLGVVVDPVQPGEHPVAPGPIDRLGLRHPVVEHGRGIAAQRRPVVPAERGRGADDIAGEADPRGRRERQQMRPRRILDVDPPVQELVGLGVLVRETVPDLPAVIRLGEEAGGAQHQARQSVQPVHELAEILGRGLGDAVDVARHGGHGLVDPAGRLTRGAGEGRTEGAGGAGEHERFDPGGDGRLQQGQRAGDVGVDERLPGMGGHVRLMQGCGMDHRIGPLDGPGDPFGIGDRAGQIGHRTRHQIEPDRVPPLGAQEPHDGFAEMAGTPGYEDGHFGSLSPWFIYGLSPWLASRAEPAYGTAPVVEPPIAAWPPRRLRGSRWRRRNR